MLLLTPQLNVTSQLQSSMSPACRQIFCTWRLTLHETAPCMCAGHIHESEFGPYQQHAAARFTAATIVLHQSNVLLQHHLSGGAAEAGFVSEPLILTGWCGRQCCQTSNRAVPPASRTISDSMRVSAVCGSQCGTSNGASADTLQKAICVNTPQYFNGHFTQVYQLSRGILHEHVGVTLKLSWLMSAAINAG